MKTTALLLLALGICASAFGAHALKELLSLERLEVFQTASNYQIIMSLTLFCLSDEELIKHWVLKLLCTGIILFSFSLYALVLLDVPKLGIITPLGGTMMIVSIIFAALQERKK